MPVSSARWPGIYDSAAIAIATRQEKGRSPAGFRPERRDVIKAFQAQLQNRTGQDDFAPQRAWPLPLANFSRDLFSVRLSDELLPAMGIPR
jgi:hypothetical protein